MLGKQFDFREFSKRVRIVRFEKGMSQTRMSVDAGLTRHTINSWENGKNMPSVSNLFQFCSAYGVSMDWICGLDKGEGSYSNSENLGGGAYSEIEN